MAFPETGQYVVPDALDLVAIDREQVRGTYAETNLWIRHALATAAISHPPQQASMTVAVEMHFRPPASAIGQGGYPAGMPYCGHQGVTRSR